MTSRSVLCCWLAMLPLGLAGRLAAQSAPPEEGEKIAVLADRRINESSGLALGVRDPSLLWTHNDSGGEPCVFAVDHRGRTRAKVRVPNAANFDWEDIASRKDAEGRPWLYIGDIGDNLHLRPTLQIYQIEEPQIPTTKDGDVKETESAQPMVWHVSYPDGAKDAEALLVHPETGRIYLVTKNDSGRCAVYAVPPVLIKDKALVMEKVADLDFPATLRVGKRPKDASLVTGGDFSPDGRRLVLSTYSYLHEWRLNKEESLKDAFSRPARLIQPPLLPQLEGVCYDSDSRSLWLISEHLPTPLYRILGKD